MRNLTSPTLLALSAAAVALSACQSPASLRGGNVTDAGGAQTCEGDLGPTANTRLATVEQLIADGKFYAALAELDALHADTNKAIWLRAEALRRIDHVDEAESLYRRLLNTCLEGRAQHGLGLTYARQHQTDKAIDALNRARQLMPTDPKVRNDLGYALLLDRRWDAAQFEFLTVLDLRPKDALAARNLVLMAFMQDKPEVARSLADRFKLDATVLQRLSTQADTLMERAPAVLPSAPTLLPPESAASVPPLTSPASDAS